MATDVDIEIIKSYDRVRYNYAKKVNYGSKFRVNRLGQ